MKNVCILFRREVGEKDERRKGGAGGRKRKNMDRNIRKVKESRGRKRRR